MRKFPAVEARALASIVDPTAVGAAHQSDAAKHVAITTSAGTIVPSDLIPLIGDVAAFNFDLLGAPFALITALSFAGDLAISDLSSGMLRDILGDVSNSLRFGIGSQISLLTADIVVLTNEVNHLAEIINPATPSGTQSGVSTSVDRTAPSRTSTATFDPAAIGSLIGDAVLLGLDVTATPFELTESLTNALSAAALDLGAGQVQNVRQDFATNLRLGFVEARTRLDNDLNGIATSVARLRGTSAPNGRPSRCGEFGGRVQHLPCRRQDCRLVVSGTGIFGACRQTVECRPSTHHGAQPGGNRRRNHSRRHSL